MKFEFVDGNNDKIMNWVTKELENRLDIGNVKFQKEMPIGGFSIDEVKEEILDALLYMASIILSMNKKGE
tara:strand:+ start:1399 stop:1608 length:210 start_codon:yes stop_codon:yes gene_type:complete